MIASDSFIDNRDKKDIFIVAIVSSSIVIKWALAVNKMLAGEREGESWLNATREWLKWIWRKFILSLLGMRGRNIEIAAN